VGFELVEVLVAQFRDRPPPDLSEFALIRMQGLPDAAGEGEPELTSTCRIAGGPLVSVTVRKNGPSPNAG
jgi:hypothetical protein